MNTIDKDEQMDKLMAEGGNVGKVLEDNPIWQHHMSNVKSGKTVKNKDGSVSTVRTIIMGDGQYEYLIPTVWDSKILSNEDAWKKAMSSGIDWPKAPAGEDGVASLEYLDQQLHKNMTPTGFAQGGMIEDDQMNRLMAEGGMADDGMNIEPVTGNEVPPGSLSKEVRDDIPAKLSEGEYVVPADVVRFFGVKFFEDLRMQAKQGLSEMDADGRIGGATVDANGVPVEGQDEELTPEEEQMLMEALGTSGMAEGGMTERNPAFGARTFDRSTFSMPKSSGFESRMYYNPATKEKKSFQFMNGNPIGVIPAGFVPYTEGMETQAPVAPTTTPKVPDTNEAIPSIPNTNSGGGGMTIPTTTGTGAGSGGINYQAWADKNKEAIMADPYQFGVNALADTSGKNLSKGLGVAGMATANPLLLGGSVVSKNFNKVQNIAEANAALKVMESKGMVETPQYKQLQKQIESATSDLPLITELAVKNDVAGTGDSYFKALTKGTTPTTATRTPTKPGLAAPTSTPVKTSVGVESTPLPTSRSDSGASSTFKATAAQTQKSKDISAGKTAAAGKSYTSKGGYTSGRAEGGLVKKGAKAKSKGLASK